MRRASSSSAAVRWADPGAVAAAVAELARALRLRCPGVTRIYWYGSWVSGRPKASSDVDLCIVVDADARRMRDRVPDYLPIRFPAPLDLIVLTEAELSSLPQRAPSWYRAIVAGRVV